MNKNFVAHSNTCKKNRGRGMNSGKLAEKIKKFLTACSKIKFPLKKSYKKSLNILSTREAKDYDLFIRL